MSNVVYGGVLCVGNSKSEAHVEIATVLRWHFKEDFHFRGLPFS